MIFKKILFSFLLTCFLFAGAFYVVSVTGDIEIKYALAPEVRKTLESGKFGCKF